MVALVFLFYSVGIAIAFFLSSLFLIHYGQQWGHRHIAESGEASMKGLNTAEGAVFALMGLILAFSVSGALQRYDERKQLILQEANAISTANDRAVLLGSDTSRQLREKLKNYLGQRIALYQAPIEFSLQHGGAVYSNDHVEKVAHARDDLWNYVAAKCELPPPTLSMGCGLILPAINAVSETARLRAGSNERHPPHIIFVMLFGLGLSASLLAGFGMAAGTRSWPHMMIFSGALAFALFIVTDLEFPRLGIFNLSYFDHFLTDVFVRM